MSDTGKQSPLGVNVLGTILQNQGFYINPKVRDLAGISKYNSNYSPGELIENTCLKWLTYGLNNAFNKINSDAVNIAAGDFLVTQRYKITQVGNTDFTAIGASLNEVGVTFVVQGAGEVNAAQLVIGLTYIITNVGDTDWISLGSPDNDLGTQFVATNIAPEGTTGEAFQLTAGEPGTTGTAVRYNVDTDTYENLLNIGQSRIAALGNSTPPTYIAEDPSDSVTRWEGQATSGYGIPGDGSQFVDDEISFSVNYPYFGQGQEAKWWPFNFSNPNISASQWGWLRLIPLQAWNEFNYNGQTPGVETPDLRYFLQSFLAAQGFIDYSNKAIFAIQDSKDYLKGIYSNMDDLTSSDITGVSLANRAFGQDLLNLGKAIDLQYISTFGLPSNLLKSLKRSNGITEKLSIALLGAGFSASNITNIVNGEAPTLEQEQALYGAFSIIKGESLKEILITLNCKTKGLTSLVDLLSVKKLFPISYQSLTVPIYNTEPNPTNSKTYYLLFVNGELNPQLIAPEVVELTEEIIPPIPAPPPEPEAIIETEALLPVITIEEIIEELPPPIVLPPVEVAPVPPPPPPVMNPPPPVPPPPPVVQRGGGGGCVALESYIPLVEAEQKHNGREITKAWMLESGMKISLGTEELSIVDGQVVKTLNDYQPCVRISTADGITLVCSTTAPILTKEKGFIPATEVYGKRVAVMRNGRTWYDEVVGLEDVGMKFVRVIDAGNNSFWAGERPGSFVLHHNVPINDKYNYDKK
jgi:hypothetical protein